MTQEYQWDRALNGEWDLRIEDVTVAFIRQTTHNNYICRFMTFDDDAFPDGKTYRTMRSAKKWCERHAPIVLMRIGARVSDVA
jgi:hypothetical protein